MTTAYMNVMLQDLTVAPVCMLHDHGHLDVWKQTTNHVDEAQTKVRCSYCQ